MTNLSWRLGAVSFAVSGIVAAIVIGLLLTPDRSAVPAPGGEDIVAEETVAEDAIAGLAPSDTAPTLPAADPGALGVSAQAASPESSSVQTPRPELAPPVAGNLPRTARSLGAPVPIAGVRSLDTGGAAIVAGLDPTANIGMDSIPEDAEVLVACATADGGSDAGCETMGRDAMDPGFATLDDRGLVAMDGHETSLFLEALGTSDDEGFATFDTELLGDSLTPFVDGDQLGAVPGADGGSNPTDQTQPLLGSIGGPQSPGASPPGGGLNAGQPLDRGAGSAPGGTEGAAPGGSTGSPPGGTGSASGLPGATLPGSGGAPHDDRPSLSSPPARMALPVEVNGAGDSWGSGPSPAQTPELGSLALFGTGAASMAGYVLVRVRAGRGRRK